MKQLCANCNCYHCDRFIETKNNRVSFEVTMREEQKIDMKEEGEQGGQESEIVRRIEKELEKMRVKAKTMMEKQSNRNREISKGMSDLKSTRQCNMENSIGKEEKLESSLITRALSYSMYVDKQELVREQKMQSINKYHNTSSSLTKKRYQYSLQPQANSLKSQKISNIQQIKSKFYENRRDITGHIKKQKIQHCTHNDYRCLGVDITFSKDNQIQLNQYGHKQWYLTK